MQRQLGITSMRPGPSGNPSAPNAANTDEATANPYPDIPALLVTRRGARVTTKRAWTARRTELLEDFSREIYGRVPRAVPRVAWREVRRVSMTVGGHAVLGRELVGQVDNTRAPGITVGITLMLVTPRRRRQGGAARDHVQGRRPARRSSAAPSSRGHAAACRSRATIRQAPSS